MGKRSRKWTRTIQFRPNKDGFGLWDADTGKFITEDDLTDKEKELMFGALEELNKMIND